MTKTKNEKTKSVKSKMKNQITLSELKEYFREHYGYISNEMSDKELNDFLNRPYIQKLGRKISIVADLLADGLLADGAEAIV